MATKKKKKETKTRGALAKKRPAPPRATKSSGPARAAAKSVMKKPAAKKSAKPAGRSSASANATKATKAKSVKATKAKSVKPTKAGVAKPKASKATATPAAPSRKAPAVAARGAKKKTVPAAAAARPIRRRDALGHLDPQYAADLRRQSGKRDDDEGAFLGGKLRSSDDLAESLGEQFVATATSGEDGGEEVLDQVVPEERGGPFVESTGGAEFADGTDASNPKGAKREPFPTT